jgi:Leucine-rich repeat (LRR) protein
MSISLLQLELELTCLFHGGNISDLSFNNIEMIEGLDKLTNLQDLTLYNNRISRIENMDKLTNLHVFSIGNNNLTDLENVRLHIEVIT